MLVHNGIIENYLDLRRELTAAGYTFASDTDTECAAHLIDMIYREVHDPIAAVRTAVTKLTGSYAFGIIFSDRPDEIYATRRDSPLDRRAHRRRLVHRLGHSRTAASHPSSHPSRRGRACTSDARRGIEFFAADGTRIEKQPDTIDWTVDAANKEGYAHFMLKEIHEQPDVIRRAAARRVGAGELPTSLPTVLKTICSAR